MRRNVWKSSANWQTRTSSKTTKSPDRVWTIQFRMEELEKKKTVGALIIHVIESPPEMLVFSTHWLAWHFKVCDFS